MQATIVTTAIQSSTPADQSSPASRNTGTWSFLAALLRSLSSWPV